MSGHEVISYFRGRKPYVHVGPSPRFNLDLEEPVMAVIAETVERHGQKSDSEIKTLVYLTDPMRNLIRREKRGEDTRREVVLRPNDEV